MSFPFYGYNFFLKEPKQEPKEKKPLKPETPFEKFSREIRTFLAKYTKSIDDRVKNIDGQIESIKDGSFVCINCQCDHEAGNVYLYTTKEGE